MGRPKKSCRRTIQQVYEDLGMSWDEVKRTAKKSGPMEGCGGSPMFWSERRGLSQVSHSRKAGDDLYL